MFDWLFKDHPKGLPVLFGTEMWERFSYYGMRAILLLYLTKSMTEGGMELATETGNAIYGIYTASVYLLALPGGWIADRIWGKQKSVFWGGVTIAAGHFSMAIPFTQTFFLGLMLIVIGTGLLKPNVSAIVGDLYPQGDPRRDAGFSLFYMGINTGAFLGPIICGFLGENVSWHLGFAAAGIGMVFGLFQYKRGLPHFGGAGTLTDVPQAEIDKAKKNLFAGLATIGVIAAALTGLNMSGIWTFTVVDVAGTGAFFMVTMVVAFFLYLFVFGGLTSTEKKHTLVIFFLFIGAALFWSGFEQAGTSLTLFTDRLTDRAFLGWEIPTSWFQSLNAIYIILLAHGFGILWVWLNRQGREPSIPAKFGLGLLQLGVSFLVLAWAATYASETSMVGPSWLIVTYFLQTTGELCLSPVGLSSVTKLAPKHLVSQMMGIWFVGAAVGNLVGGLIGGKFETFPLPQLFGYVAMTVGVAGLLFLLFSRLIDRKLIGKLGGEAQSAKADRA